VINTRQPDKWDILWIDTAHRFAQQSKDRSVQVGCVIVSPDRTTLLSQGWNGFPRNADDCVDSRHERPEKYYWAIHAELNAILNHSRTGGPSLQGAIAYINCKPYPGVCSNCMAALHQVGIQSIVGPNRSFDGNSVQNHYNVTTVPESMMHEMNMVLTIVDYDLK